MENASKALIMAGAVLIAIMIVTIGVYLVGELGKTSESYVQQLDTVELQKYNSNFEVFIDRTDITAQEIVTVAGIAKQREQGTKVYVGGTEVTSQADEEFENWKNEFLNDNILNLTKDKEELEKMNIKFEYGKFIKPVKRHAIKIQKQEIADDVENICTKGQNSKVLVIVNTVDKAIELYSKIKEMEDINVNLLHSRYILRDRNEKEKQIKEFSNTEANHGIWISTQIVEASLDIDFDYLYTEMSTLDSLFQRLGRCYRSRGNCYRSIT